MSNSANSRARLRDLLRARAGEQQVVAAFRGGGGFLQEIRAADGLIAFGCGNGVPGKQIRGAHGVGVGKFEIGQLRFPIRFGGGDFLFARSGFELRQLRRHAIASRVKFGGVQFRDDLAVRERIAFLREKFLNAAAVAGADMNFIRFNGAGNRGGSRTGCTNSEASPAQPR